MSRHRDWRFLNPYPYYQQPEPMDPFEYIDNIERDLDRLKDRYKLKHEHKEEKKHRFGTTEMFMLLFAGTSMVHMGLLVILVMFLKG